MPSGLLLFLKAFPQDGIGVDKYIYIYIFIFIFIFIIKYGLEFMGPGVAGCGQGQAFGSGHIAR